MREIKFRYFFNTGNVDNIFSREVTLEQLEWNEAFNGIVGWSGVKRCQYTGLKDKNGSGLTEVYEGDIISIDGTLKGNIYENDKEPTDIVIPQLGTKAWADAYKEAVERGYDYSE